MPTITHTDVRPSSEAPAAFGVGVMISVFAALPYGPKKRVLRLLSKIELVRYVDSRYELHPRGEVRRDLVSGPPSARSVRSRLTSLRRPS